jgi:hypothetical protein
VADAGAGGGEADWDLEIALRDGPTGLGGSSLVGEPSGVVLSGCSAFDGGLRRSGVTGSGDGRLCGTGDFNASSKTSRDKEATVQEVACGLTFTERSADDTAELKSEPSVPSSIFSGSRSAITSSSNLLGFAGEALSMSSSSSFGALVDCEINPGFLTVPKILDDPGVSEVPAQRQME